MQQAFLSDAPPLQPSLRSFLLFLLLLLLRFWFLVLWRQGFSVDQSKLSWNLPCRPDWPALNSHRSTFPYFKANFVKHKVPFRLQFSRPIRPFCNMVSGYHGGREEEGSGPCGRALGGSSRGGHLDVQRSLCPLPVCHPLRCVRQQPLVRIEPLVF